MAILDFTNNENSAVPVRNQRMPFATMGNGVEGQRPKAKVWMNIGRDVGGKFISIPLGQPIDTMEPKEIRGQNEEFVKQTMAQNELLKAIQQLGGTLTPGQEVTLNLQVKIRRINEALEITKAENEFAIDASTLLVQEHVEESLVS